jgi:hypothetical protein
LYLSRSSIVKKNLHIFSLIFHNRLKYYCGMAKQTLPQEFRDYLAKLGRKGGLKGGPARAASMTPERRREIAQKAIRARWAKRKKQLNVR